MTTRSLRRYIDDLLRGRRPNAFRPDDFEAAQIRTAIDLQAARQGSDAPGEEFLADLHRRLAAQQDGTGQPAPVVNASRRTVIVGTSAAAAAAVAAVSIDRALVDGSQVADGGRRPRAHPERWALDAGRGQRRRNRRRHAAFRCRLRHRLRSSCERQARSRVRRVHPPGLPTVVRRARRPVALPVPFDVVRSRRPGVDPSTPDSAEAVAHVDGS